MLFDKIYGCILGGAVGDAFGAPLEGMSADYIRKPYNGSAVTMQDFSIRPKDFFQSEFAYVYAWTKNAGSHTDDTYMAGLLAQCII